MLSLNLVYSFTKVLIWENSVFFYLKNFFWNRVNLQYCVNFRCTERWVWDGSLMGLISWSGVSSGESNGSHPSILAWEVLWTEEPGRLQSTGLQRVRHERMTEHMSTPCFPILAFIVTDFSLCTVFATSLSFDLLFAYFHSSHNILYFLLICFLTHRFFRSTLLS